MARIVPANGRVLAASAERRCVRPGCGRVAVVQGDIVLPITRESVRRIYRMNLPGLRLCAVDRESIRVGDLVTETKRQEYDAMFKRVGIEPPDWTQARFEWKELPEAPIMGPLGPYYGKLGRPR